jgi:hypothetical protein
MIDNEKAATCAKVTAKNQTDLLRLYQKLFPEATENAIKKLIQRRRDIPRQYRKLYDRCITGQASPREAIKMQCLECCAWVKYEVVACNNHACSLFKYRPYQEVQNPVKSPTERLDASSVDELTSDGKLLQASSKTQPKEV